MVAGSRPAGGAGKTAGQQCGAVFEAHHGERRFGAAFLLQLGLGGVMLVWFVVVDPDAFVVPVSL
jgi:hypothetical protein